MLDTAPKESESRSWIYVTIGVLVIYLTIPVARAARELVNTYVGREVFLYLTLAGVLVGAVIALRNLHRRGLTRAARAWLLLVFAVYAAFIWHLRAIPEEALHVVEYGLLGLLVYRALTHRLRDYSIYPLAFLLTGIVGMVDEYIQWIVPSRYYDIRDIGVNFLSAALAQVALFAGLRPRLIATRPAAASLGKLCFAVAAVLALLSLAFVNTPQRVARYTAELPRLQFLLDSRSMMAQYGYLHGVAQTGVFRSRFDRDQLRRLDAERGTEAAAILDRYLGNDGYATFLSRYSVTRDPWVHEAGVHLFRRQFHLDRARENNRHRVDHYSIAYFENRILQDYFGSALNQSAFHWDASVELEVSRNARTSEAYESRVSSAVITRFSEFQVLSAFGGGIILLLLLGTGLVVRQWSRRPS